MPERTSQSSEPAAANQPNLNTEKVCFIIVKAREFDVKEEVIEPDYASDAVDDKFVQVLEDRADDAAVEEIKSLIEAMNEDEQLELIALAWVGRGDFGTEEWPEAVALARERRVGPTSEYLLGLPLLGDYLEEGLSAFGRNCADVEAAHL